MLFRFQGVSGHRLADRFCCAMMTMEAMMYNSLVRPIAVYGAESWTMLPRHDHLADVADMGWVCRIAGVSLWQELPSEEIRRKAHRPVRLIEAGR